MVGVRIRVFVVLAFVMLVGALVFAATAGAQSAGQGQYGSDQLNSGDGGTTDALNSSDGGNNNLTADAQRDAAGFNCVDIVEISRSANRGQYDVSSARLQECLAREVLDGGVKGRLADTGGAPLLPIAGFVLVGLGLFVGRAVLARRDG
jgi:hypothetical protein